MGEPAGRCPHPPGGLDLRSGHGCHGRVARGCSVDGATRQASTGNTSTLRVDTVLLGVTAGVTQTATSSMKGTAYVDSFVSTRYTLP